MSEETTQATEPGPEQSAQHRARANGKLREITRRPYTVFRSEAIDISDVGAAILTIHLCSTVEKHGSMSEAQLRDWALRFKSQHPMVWVWLRRGVVSQFLLAMRRCGVETPSEEDYQKQLGVVQSAA